MTIVFAPGWNSGGNHTSQRSQNELARIIQEIPELNLLYDHSEGSLRTHLEMGWDVTVTKGIHDDSRGKHITINVSTLGSNRTWHLYLKQSHYSRSDNTFIWEVAEIR